MPKYTIYIKVADNPAWLKIKNRPKWLHEMIQSTKK